MNEREISEYIIDNLEDKLDYMLYKTDYKVFSIIHRGSGNYGLFELSDEYASDVDAVCFILPSLEDIIKGKKMVSTNVNMEDGSQIEIKDIRLAKELFIKANPSYLELLFSEYKLNWYDDPHVPTKFHEELDEMANDIALMNFDRLLSAVKGMINEKNIALCRDYKDQHEAIMKLGYSPKQMHHIYRLKKMLMMLVDGNKYRDTLRCFDEKETKFMMDVKKGLYPKSIDEAKRIAEEQTKLTDDLLNDYREKNGRAELNQETLDKLDDLIYRIVYDSIRQEFECDIFG